MDLLLKRIEVLNPTRSKLYSKWFENYLDNTFWKSGVILIDIPDTGGGWIPKDCRLEQIAIQREPKLPKQRWYTINLDLWEKMDSKGKAGLLLHEFILRELTDIPHSTCKRKTLKDRLLSYQHSSYVVDYLGRLSRPCRSLTLEARVALRLVLKPACFFGFKAKNP